TCPLARWHIRGCPSCQAQTQTSRPVSSARRARQSSCRCLLTCSTHSQRRERWVTDQSISIDLFARRRRSNPSSSIRLSPLWRWSPLWLASLAVWLPPPLPTHSSPPCCREPSSTSADKGE